MPKQIVNIGLTPGDGSGDNIRDAFDKIQENFDEIWENLSTNGIDLRVSRIAKTGSYNDLINRPNPLAGSSAGEGGIIVGPRGPIGDPGPAGPQGEQGPPGLDLIDDTITSFITSWSSSRISNLIDTLDDLSQTIRRATATPPPPAPELLPPGPGSAPLPSDAVFLERFNSIPMSRSPEIAPVDWEWFNESNIINSFATGTQIASPLYPGFLTAEQKTSSGFSDGGIAFYSTQSYLPTVPVEVTNFSKIYFSVSYLPHDPDDFSWHTESSVDLQQTLECLTITDIKRISLTVKITRAVDVPSEYDLEVTRIDEIGELFAATPYTNRFTQRLTDLPQNLVFELDLTQSDITTNISGTGRSSFYDSSAGSWVEVSNPAGGVVVGSPPFSIGQMYVLALEGSFVDYLLMGESNNEVAYRPVRTPVPEYATPGSLVFMEDFNTYLGYRYLGGGDFEQALWDETASEPFLRQSIVPSYAAEGSKLLLPFFGFGIGLDEYTDQQGRAYAFGYQTQRYFSDPIDFTEDYRIIDDVERIGARLVRVPVGNNGDISRFFGDITVQVAIHFEGPIIRGFGKYFFTFTEASGYTQHLPSIGTDLQVIVEDPNLGRLAEALLGGGVTIPTAINIGDSFDFYVDVFPERPSGGEYATFVLGDTARYPVYDEYQESVDNPQWKSDPIAIYKTSISVKVIDNGFVGAPLLNRDDGFNPFVVDYFYGQNRNGDLNLGAV